MAVEIEAKLKVDDLGLLRDKLVAAAAARHGKVRETNTYLATSDDDVALRVRREVDEGGHARVRVTFKGPRQPGAFKQREEIEFDAGDADAAVTIFARVGHKPVLVFEKDRETFALDGCEVVLDELPQLGKFVEIEGPSEDAVRRVLDKLGLGEGDVLVEGYAAMLVAKGLTDVRFAGE